MPVGATVDGQWYCILPRPDSVECSHSDCNTQTYLAELSPLVGLIKNPGDATGNAEKKLVHAVRVRERSPR